MRVPATEFLLRRWVRRKRNVMSFCKDCDSYGNLALSSRNKNTLRCVNAVDIVVVDQRTGPCVACNWVTFGRVDWDKDPKRPVAVCRANPTRITQIVAPKGWVFERSLSAQHVFAENGKTPANLKLVRHEDGLDVYGDAETGQEFYVARSRPSGDPPSGDPK